MLREIIVPLSSLCTGCRACEVACGFHHTSNMHPHHSSIHVERQEPWGTFHVTLDESCDVCPRLEIPACIQICGVRALTLGRKRVFKAQKGKT